jgi:hypothetical protein
MPRACLIFGVIAFIALLGGRAQSYFEGQSFDKSWASPLLGLFSFGCLLAYLVTVASAVVAAIQKKVRWPWLIAIFAVPVCWFGSYQVPIPSFTDGMQVGLQQKVSSERLKLFAAAMVVPESPNPEELPDKRVELMKREFPEIYRLSTMEPRVSIGDDFVEIFWGSALVKHWGVRIGSRPFSDASVDYQKGVSYREAYEGIWVYHDRY